MDFLDCVHRPTRGAIAVGIVLEVSLKDWFQHQLGGGLNHPVADRRNAERTLPSAVRLRDHHPPHRTGPVRPRDQFLDASRPDVSIAAKVTPSTPGAPALPRAST